MDSHDDGWFFSQPQRANDLDFVIEEGMKAIIDPRPTELMSSMRIRYDIPTRRDCWKREWIC